MQNKTLVQTPHLYSRLLYSRLHYFRLLFPKVGKYAKCAIFKSNINLISICFFVLVLVETFSVTNAYSNILSIFVALYKSQQPAV